MNSRAKGKRYELEAANSLSKLLRSKVSRNHREQADGGGVDLVGDVLRHFAPEVKSASTPRWSEWIEQAERQAAEGQYPIIMQHRDRQPWRCLVVLDLVQLAEFIRLQNHLRDGRL